MRWKTLVILLLLFATPAAAQDAIDLSHATVERSAPDVASWPITTAITRLELGASDCAIDFSMKEVWPNVPIPGWNGGSIAYTLWMVRIVGGQVYTGGGIEFWNGTNGNPTRVGGCGPAASYIANWYYDASWGPLNTAGELTPGETVGFFVTAGDARAKDVRTVTARSAVVAVPWPGGTGGVFTFGPPPVPAPAGPPPQPPPPPPPSPATPSAPPAASIDLGGLTALVQQLVAGQQQQLAVERDTNVKVAAVEAQVKTFGEQFGEVMKFVGKYVAPAIGAWFGGKAMAK